MLQRFYWWMRSWARKISRQTVHWPVLPIPLPISPGIHVSVDYVEPLPTTARGKSYIFLFTDRFSRRADMFAVTTDEFTAEGNAVIQLLWSVMSTRTTGTSSYPMSNMLTTTPSARPRVLRRMKSILDVYRTFLSPFLIAHTAAFIRA